MMQKIVIIAGPTASGKSAFAQALAREKNGVIINADSMQMYHPLRVLTARPSAEEEAAAPHKLYGKLPAKQVCSAGKWVELAKAEIDAAHAVGQLPIVVGGTGLYIKTLMEGISPIPEVPDAVKQVVRKLDKTTLHDLLKQRDPEMAAKLRPTDTQRVMRALEVLEATGKSLAYWQAIKPAPYYPKEMFAPYVMEVDRGELYDRCDWRFVEMLDQGAIEEVKALIALDLPDELPIMRAVGVPEIRGYLGGEYNREKMIDKAQQATRNYAKRQLTWARNQTKEFQIVIDYLAILKKWADLH